MGTDGREEGIRSTNRAGEIKAPASALAGAFNFLPPLTLWRARALPLYFDWHFIRADWWFKKWEAAGRPRTED
jgi:hypothetical protein